MTAGIRHSTVRANGIRIHVAEQGEGPMVLLLHGFPELWYSWRHQLPALADAGYRAVAIDQRGYGGSSKLWQTSEFRVSKMVADAVGVVHALGEKTAVVVGHDWGAPIAWTAAWMHPEVFRGVVGMSVPFSARALVAIPGSPFGERRPVDAHRYVAGEGQDFYQEYFGALDEIVREIESDVRGWIRDVVHGFSGDPPLPPGVDLATVDVVELIRTTAATIPHGKRMRDRLSPPARQPDWFTDADLDVFAAEYERTGFLGPLSYYRAMDESWAELEPWAKTPVRVPAAFIGAERDAATIWGREAIARAKEWLPELVSSVILPRCGHWIQQEEPAETNRLLLEFLRRLR